MITMWLNPSNGKQKTQILIWDLRKALTTYEWRWFFIESLLFICSIFIYYYLYLLKYFLFISTFDKLLKLRGILNFGSKQIKMALKSFQVCSVKLDFTFIYPRYHWYWVHEILRTFSIYWFKKRCCKDWQRGRKWKIIFTQKKCENEARDLTTSLPRLLSSEQNGWLFLRRWRFHSLIFPAKFIIGAPSGKQLA